ncbi:xylulokinase [Haoranjiania flava]|uniref:FGGY family carbohydrate kinase n=1 Tax=Haoranjiania flava TaxID=1856322 RepID=A0AAE3IMG1_9BACT|nr:FGGY family carbohydrate kinase [Haoranjiania flava]MCU7693016.1 FGGY family carbohydrate kinase [Haoranjiania flava]
MLLLGLDIGTSSIKASVVDANTQKPMASAIYPDTEAEIVALNPGWAEQDPESWWEYVQHAIIKCNNTGSYNAKDIAAIGIAYQMHGLVLVDKDQKVLRNSIIWCDSRAVEIGSKAFQSIGEDKCLSCLLNSPGNFTAAKLAWVKANEPRIYEKINKVMLPGDFVAMKLTDEITTSISALSEGIFWDFEQEQVSDDVMEYYGFHKEIIPEIKPLFSSHGILKTDVAVKLALKPGIPVTYKAGDQPNNALALNVLQPGEVAATAGTSGVIYGISDQLAYDDESRINSFAHVNYTTDAKRVGILLCINGTGIFNRWIKAITGKDMSYAELDGLASSIVPGAEGLTAIPFGNGAERMLHNKIIGAHFHNIDFNVHTTPHLLRAVQESIAFSFRDGLDIMRGNGISPSVVRASKANMFLSNLFAQTFANVNNVTVEFYDGDGSYGAAIGAGIGAGILSVEDAGKNRKPLGCIKPENVELYNDLYIEWKNELQKHLS